MKNFGVIFDIDGTLLDSIESIKEAVCYALDYLKIKELSKKELDKFVCTSPLKKAFLEYCNLKDFKNEEACRIYREHYVQKTMKKAKIYPYLFELLKYLKTNNYQIGIATYKKESQAIAQLKCLNIDKYFDPICGADADGKLNKKDILNNAIKQMGLDCKNIIFVGDSPSDAIAAKELNVKFLAIAYGYGFKNKEEIASNPHEKIINNPKELLDYFKN